MHHHKRDWNQYNKELINRCKIDFWIPHNVCWQAPRCKKNGCPFVYTDEAIKAMLYIRFKFHLSLRELEGFFISLMQIRQTSTKVPCYTQVYGISKPMLFAPLTTNNSNEHNHTHHSGRRATAVSFPMTQAK